MHFILIVCNTVIKISLIYMTSYQNQLHHIGYFLIQLSFPPQVQVLLSAISHYIWAIKKPDVSKIIPKKSLLVIILTLILDVTLYRVNVLTKP